MFQCQSLCHDCGFQCTRQGAKFCSLNYRCLLQWFLGDCLLVLVGDHWVCFIVLSDIPELMLFKLLFVYGENMVRCGLSGSLP